MKIPRSRNLLMKVLKTGLHFAGGVLFTLIIVFVLYLNGREDLSIWHTVDLDEEFTVDSDVGSFVEYLELEDRLFAQLDDLVYAQTKSGGDTTINRFRRGGLSDPDRWPRNWNRSYEYPGSGASVLLLHGLSDSPYSLRNMARRLQQEDAYVIGLRVPGHGTAPSGLTSVTWEDMAAAVELAMHQFVSRNPGQPIHIIGYSNGAALGVHYALATLDQPELPAVASLVLLSPEIGVTRAAAFAIWQGRLSWMLGLEKLAWNSISPEYDPYKYGSFAINAADVSHRITGEIQSRISLLTKQGLIGNMPPVLAFSSVVDATVLAPALIENLLNRLPQGGHRLVLFDINHMAGIEPLLKWSPDSMLNALQQNPHPSFSMSLLTNKTSPNGLVEIHAWAEGSDDRSVESTALRWPVKVYSLTHVALPFPAGDPIYGGQPESVSPGIALGEMAAYGERGVLSISASEMLRLRWNPFYDYLEQETLEFMSLASR